MNLSYPQEPVVVNGGRRAIPKTQIEYDPRQLLIKLLERRIELTRPYFPEKYEPENPPFVAYQDLSPVTDITRILEEFPSVPLGALDKYLDKEVLPPLKLFKEYIHIRAGFLLQQGDGESHEGLSNEHTELSKLEAALSSDNKCRDMLNLRGNYVQIGDLLLGIEEKVDAEDPTKSGYEVLLIALYPSSDATRVIHSRTFEREEVAREYLDEVHEGLKEFPFRRYDLFGISGVKDLDSVEGVSLSNGRLNILNQQQMVYISFPLSWDGFPESEFWGFENFLHERTIQNVLERGELRPEEKDELSLVLTLNRYDFMRHRSASGQEPTRKILGVPSLPAYSSVHTLR